MSFCAFLRYAFSYKSEPDYTLYPLIQSHFEGNVVVRCQAPLDGEGLHDVAITGSGIIDGGGQGWRPVKKSKMTEAAWSKLVDSGGCVHADGDMWWPSMEAMASGSMMFVYALAKGLRLGYLESAFHSAMMKGYEGIVKHLAEVDESGVHLHQISVLI